MPQPWPTTPGDRPPLAPGSTSPWPARGTSVLDRPGNRAGSRPAGRGGAPPGRPEGAAPGPPPTAWITVVAVLSALLVITFVALVWSRSTEPTASGPTTGPRPTTTRPGGRSGPTTTAPSGLPPSVLPPPPQPTGRPPTVAEVQAAVDELVGFVQQHRGLTFTSRPPVKVEEAAAFDAAAREEFDRRPEGWRRRSQLLGLLGAVDPGVNVAAVFRMLDLVGRVARYDLVSRTIVVRGQPLTAYTRAQLVVALTIALDDQRFGLERPYDEAFDEIRWAFDALVLGDASRLLGAWLDSLPPAEQDAVTEAEEEQLNGFDIGELPPAVHELHLFPTDAGAAFAAALTRGGNGPLDAALGDPPHTTAEVLHPERYLGHVPVVPVPPPAVEGRVHLSGVFGELMTVATLADTATREGAARAAAGWAGDSYVLYEDANGAECVRIAYRASSPAGLDQLFQAYATWSQSRSHEGAEVRVDGETLLVTRCASGGGYNPA